MKQRESVSEGSAIENFMPQMFGELHEKIKMGAPVELNEINRRLILKWTYSNLLDEDAIWGNSHNGVASLDKTMRQVNNVAQDAGVNTHDREHVNLTLANAVYLCWVDFIAKNKDTDPAEWNLNELLKDTLQHATAALLHDVGYLGSLPRSSADFRHFLTQADKKNFNNHPKVSAVHAKEVLEWMTEEGNEGRLLSVLNPETVTQIGARTDNLWKSAEEKQQWCSEICEAISDHGTAQIVAEEGGEERSALSKNLMLADKIHVERRLNFSNSIPKADAQQNIFPNHKKGKPEEVPGKHDISNAAHTRVAEAVEGTRFTIDLVKKKVEWVLEYNPARVEKLAEEHDVIMGFTYDDRVFSHDFERAYGGFNEKLKQIMGDWDVEIQPVSSNHNDSETGQ